ncbi:MAG: AlpA family phage regulatory protein [Pseudomonadota bacterium]
MCVRQAINCSGVLVSNRTPKTSDAALASLPLEILRPADVCTLLRISRPTLWRLRRAGEFPNPAKLSKRSIGWRRVQVEAWITARSQSTLNRSETSTRLTPGARDSPLPPEVPNARGKRKPTQIQLELTR